MLEPKISNCSYIYFGIIKLEQNAFPLLYIRNIYKILVSLDFSAKYQDLISGSFWLHGESASNIKKEYNFKHAVTRPWKGMDNSMCTQCGALTHNLSFHPSMM